MRFLLEFFSIKAPMPKSLEPTRYIFVPQELEPQELPYKVVYFEDSMKVQMQVSFPINYIMVDFKLAKSPDNDEEP